MANGDMQAHYDDVNPAALRRLVAGGAVLRPFNQEILAACFKAANQTYDEIGAKNEDFKKIYESMKALSQRREPLVPDGGGHLRQLHAGKAARRQALTRGGRHIRDTGAPEIPGPFRCEAAEASSGASLLA